jgi:phospholipase A-2-activating protein
MDLSRLVAAYCADASAAPGGRERFFASLFKASDWTEVRSHGKAMSKAQETNILLLFRTIANCFQEGTPVDEGRWVAQAGDFIFQSKWWFSQEAGFRSAQ